MPALVAQGYGVYAITHPMAGVMLLWYLMKPWEVVSQHLLKALQGRANTSANFSLCGNGLDVLFRLWSVLLFISSFNSGLQTLDVQKHYAVETRALHKNS